MAMLRRSARTPSPSKKRQQLDDFNVQNDNNIVTAAVEEEEMDIQHTHRPFSKTHGTRRDRKAAGLSDKIVRSSSG